MRDDKELEYFYAAVEVILGDNFGKRQMTDEEDHDAAVLALRALHSDPQRDFSDEEVETFQWRMDECLADGIVEDAEAGHEESVALVREILRKSKLN